MKSPLILVLALLGLGGCIVGDLIHGESTAPVMIPVLRYVEYKDGRVQYEDISEGNPQVSAGLTEFPAAQGAMHIDCTSVRELGIMIRHAYRSKSTGYQRHDFDYAVSWPDAGIGEPRHLTYEVPLRNWYYRGAARFREPLVDGKLNLSVIHRRKSIYTTQFDVVGCQ